MGRMLWIVALGSLLAVDPAGPSPAPAAVSLESESARLERADGGLVFRCTVQNPRSRATGGVLDAWIADLDGTVLTRNTREVDLAPGANECEVALSGTVPVERVSKCMLHYYLKAGGGESRGAKLLVNALPQLETRVVTHSKWLAGSEAAVRVAAMDPSKDAPVTGAAVKLTLAGKTVYEGATNDQGTLDTQFKVPEEPVGDTDLVVEVSATGLGQDRVTQRVTLAREAKILLTTDKPMYQPGQTMHLRTLSLDKADLTPAAKQSLVFEVMDSKGNKVFKKPVDTDDYGVAAADFVLASEVNLGTYTARAVLGGTQAEKQVTVERYVLPKFKVEVKPDKPYYLPGQTLQGDVQADYFFGKPVAGAKVRLTASKFEIEFEEFATVEGTLDQNGHWSFEMPLPEYFAGTPIEQGQASVRLQAQVTDTADHLEEKVVMTPVAKAEMTVAAVPEGGSLAPALANRVYVLVSYADGTPAAGAEVRAAAPQGNAQVGAATAQTDALGVATVEVTPQGQGPVAFHVDVRDRQGRGAGQDFVLNAEGGGAGLILRTDKALYRVGDTLQAEVFSTKAKGTVYLDLLREGQLVMTRAADFENGRASVDLSFDAGTTGSLVLNAYTYTSDTDTVRDTRLLYVNPADALRLDIRVPQDTYKPGESAQVQFSVTDAEGLPAAAALGVSIVDESVFALQEIHPGLEKIYFTLEEEIMKPRYEIHGYELTDMVVRPVPMPGPAEGVPAQPAVWSDEQQRAAQVLLASAPEPPETAVRVNTFSKRRLEAQAAVQERMQKDIERIRNAVQTYLKTSGNRKPSDLLSQLLRRKYLRENELTDPWGNRYEINFANMESWGGHFVVTSSGPDGKKGTGDDIRLGSHAQDENKARRRFRAMAVMEEGVAMPMVAPPASAADAAEMPMEKAEMDVYAAGGLGGGAGLVAEPVRVRQYFPETLLFEPSLITDAQGKAVLDVPLADSITTWRMTTMASAATGALGSKDSPLRVFQDFFVDIDLPVALTQNDRVSIPVALYNYLKEPQEVRVKFEEQPWFKLDGPAEQAVPLGPGEVKSVYFPIEVEELGKHTLTVYGYGSQMSDAMKREIEILPDGEEKLVTFSDRLTGDVTHTVEIPGDAIAGASKILVRVYPGVYSQIVDGLDSMLQMPSGCFEQTSSITYPNILIVQYLKATEQINPEVQMKAEGFINAGYQRLLSYEVDGGGYSWFGDAPANQVLTAWGLKEFYDMSQIHEVDPAVIERTRQWLLGKQQPDGSWKPDEQYLHEESWGGIQKSGLLVTAYIADAVIGAGAKGAEVDKAVDYIRNQWKDTEEAYVLALVANALVSWNAKDPWTSQVLDKLYGLRVEEGETVHWKGGVNTVTFSHGNAANVETTALVAIALLNSGKYPEAATKALTYLIREKSAQGHWGSTQATILALKALMLSLSSRTEEVDATIRLTMAEKDVSELKITPQDSDVMRLVDLGDRTQTGANVVKLSLAGEGSMLYQVVGRYYVPWGGGGGPQPLMSIDVQYDKRELAVNDTVTASVKVTNNRPETAQMIVVDLGIPPGFQVMTPDLDGLVQQNVLDKYEMTGRQVIGYFEEIGGNATIEFQYRLQAKFPLKAQTPASRVYEYYNPEISAKATPVAMVVE